MSEVRSSGAKASHTAEETVMLGASSGEASSQTQRKASGNGPWLHHAPEDSALYLGGGCSITPVISPSSRY